MKKREEKWSRDATCTFLKQKKEEECILVFSLFVFVFFLNESSFDESAWCIVEAHFLPLWFFSRYCIYQQIKNNLHFLCVCVCERAHSKAVGLLFFLLSGSGGVSLQSRGRLSSSINLQVRRSSISDGDDNAALWNVIVFCRCQTITVKYLLLLFVCVRANSHLGFKGKSADSVIKKGWSN